MLIWLLTTLALAADWPSDDAATAPWSELASGVALQDVTVGTGDEVLPRSAISVHYTGMLADGTVFDTSRDRGETLDFRVGDKQVIEGWEHGVVGMRVGGVRRLVIPPDQGYGARATGTIPAHATLFFEVELVSVRPPRVAPAAPAQPQEVRVRGTVRLGDVVVGRAGRAVRKHKVCLDYAVFRDDALLDHTYGRKKCTWLRLDGEQLPMELELGLKGMRAGGTRWIALSTGEVYLVELTDTAR